MKELVEAHEPDIIMLTETKLQQCIDLSGDLACNPQIDRAVQLDCTLHHRGGMIIIVKKSLRLETAELIRVAETENFIQVIVLADRLGHALILWYSAPTVEVGRFGEELKRVLSEYKIQVLAGDFNARHPQWCTDHDDKKKGVQLIRKVKDCPGHIIHATQNPTFQAPRYRNRGRFGSRTIDIVVASAPIHNLVRLEGELTEGSNHFPINFLTTWDIDREPHTRRVPKTFMQSTHAREAIGIV